MSPGGHSDADRYSAAYLLYLSALLQEELGVWLESGGEDGERVPTLSLGAEIRFDSARQRAAFADSLQRAVTEVIARHTSPACDVKGQPRGGRAYRLLVGCYPVHDGDEAQSDDK
jgi:hypothetical protein